MAFDEQVQTTPCIHTVIFTKYELSEFREENSLNNLISTGNILTECKIPNVATIQFILGLFSIPWTYCWSLNESWVLNSLTFSPFY